MSGRPWEWLVAAALCVALAVLAPIAATGSEIGHHIVLGSGAALALIMAGLAWRGVALGRGRFVVALLFLPTLLATAVICGAGYFVFATAIHPWGGPALLLAHLTCFLWAANGVVRGRSRVGQRATFLGMTVVASFLYTGLTAAMWAPANPSECAAVNKQPGVRWLTPPDWLQSTAQVNDILIVPSRSFAAATYKNASNRMLPWWDDPQANKLALHSLDAPSEVSPPAPRVLDFGARLLPENLAWEPRTQRLWMTALSIGQGPSFVLQVDPGRATPIVRRSQVGRSPHMFGLRDRPGGYVVFGQTGQRMMLNAHFEKLQELPAPEAAGPMVFIAWSHPGTRKTYMSHLGTGVLEYDPATHETTAIPTVFAAGVITGSAKHNRVYQTDVGFNALNVVDLKERQLVKRIDLGFKPRPVAVHEGRDVLAVGEWLSGRIHLYRLSTLQPLGQSFEAGPYVRVIQADEANGRLWVGSKCGVVTYDLPPVPAD